MACHLFGAKPFSEQMQTIRQLDLQENWNMEWFFFQSNTITNVVCNISPFFSDLILYNHSNVMTRMS